MPSTWLHSSSPQGRGFHVYHPASENYTPDVQQIPVMARRLGCRKEKLDLLEFNKDAGLVTISEKVVWNWT
jgi:hypothetical protein